MDAFVRAVGIFILVAGVLIAAKPHIARMLIGFAKVGKRVQIGGGIRILIGILFFVALPHVAWPWIVGIFGLLALASGVTILSIGVVRAHQFLDWFFIKTDKEIRIYSAILVAMGILLIYAA